MILNDTYLSSIWVKLFKLMRICLRRQRKPIFPGNHFLAWYNFFLPFLVLTLVNVIKAKHYIFSNGHSISMITVNSVYFLEEHFAFVLAQSQVNIIQQRIICYSEERKIGFPLLLTVTRQKGPIPLRMFSKFLPQHFELY